VPLHFFTVRSVRSVLIDIGSGLQSRYQELLTNDAGLIIHAIQPYPDVASELRELAGRCYGRLHVHEFAMTIIDTNGIKKLPFHLTSDTTSSGLLPLDPGGVRRWRNPPGRRRFHPTGQTFVAGKTMETFLNEIWLNGNITCVNISVPGYASRVLEGISTMRTWNVIKEIVVKVQTTGDRWELYRNQSRPDDVIETMAVHGFNLHNQKPSSFGQETTLWFRNMGSVDIKWPFGTHGLVSRFW